MPELNHNPPEALQETLAPPKKSRGEKLFDWLVYGGLNGVGTFLLTIPLAYWGKYGSGAEKYKQAASFMEKIGVKAKYAEEVMLMVVTSFGGTAMVAPVRIAEHFRTPIVNTLNGKPAEAQTPETMNHTKQTWGSLLRGRLLAMATVMVSFRTAGAFFPEQFKKFEHGVAQKICTILGKDTHDATKLAALELQHGTLTEALRETAETKPFRYGKMAAIDVFATTAATILLYTGSRFFARKRDEHRAAHPKPLMVPMRGGAFADSLPENELTQEKAEPSPLTAIGGEKQHTGVMAEMPAVKQQPAHAV